jgi:hypothetical protein
MTLKGTLSRYFFYIFFVKSAFPRPLLILRMFTKIIRVDINLSRKYDPGCSSRIRILTFYPSRIRILTFYPSGIPDPGVKKAPDSDPQHWSHHTEIRPPLFKQNPHYIFYRFCRYYDGPPMLSYRSRERSRSYDREGSYLFLHLCY